MNWIGVIKESILPRIPPPFFFPNNDTLITNYTKRRIENGFIMFDCTYETESKNNPFELLEYSPLNVSTEINIKMYIQLLSYYFDIEANTWTTESDQYYPLNNNGKIYLDVYFKQRVAQFLDPEVLTVLYAVPMAYIPVKNLHKLTWSALNDVPKIWEDAGFPVTMKENRDITEWINQNQDILLKKNAFSVCFSQLAYKEETLFRELEFAFKLKRLEIPDSVMETQYPCINYKPKIDMGYDWFESSLRDILMDLYPRFYVSSFNIVPDVNELNEREGLPFVDDTLSDSTVCMRVGNYNHIAWILGIQTLEEYPQRDLPDLKIKDNLVTIPNTNFQPIHVKNSKVFREDFYSGDALTPWGAFMWDAYGVWSIYTIKREYY